MQWWYVKDGKREGPVEESELRAMAQDGRIGPDDLVWNSTMGQEWKKASTVPGVFFAPAAAVPALADPPPPAQKPVPRSDFSMPAGPAKVSVSDPVESAWAVTKRILFQPFDMAKWFALGFTAWLATLMEGGSGGNFNLPSDAVSEEVGSGAGGFETMAEEMKTAFESIGPVVIALIAVGVVVGLVIGVVVLWVRSRGKFMFLDNVVHNSDKVKVPWREFKQHGNSLFIWTLGFSAVMLLLVLFLLGGAFVGIILPCMRAGEFLASTWPVIIVVGLIWLVVAIISGYVMRFLEDFVIPIMYKNDMTAAEAWSCFGRIYAANVGKFLWYGLFYVILGIGAGIVVLLAVLLTCCLLGCIAMIPYVGTIAMLPVLVFFRAYSLYYLAQYGPDLDLVKGSECSGGSL